MQNFLLKYMQNKTIHSKLKQNQTTKKLKFQIQQMKYLEKTYKRTASIIEIPSVPPKQKRAYRELL